MHLKWLCIPAALTCLISQVATARNIFLTPGDFSSSYVSTFSTDPLTFGANIGSIAGAFTVLPSSSAAKYYVISRSSTDSVTVLEGRFPNLTVGRKISISQELSAAALTPDGRRLVLVGAGGVEIVDTGSESSIVLMGTLDVGANAIDVATSLDSTRAFVLSAGSSRLTAVDLSTNQVAGSLQIATVPNAVTVGPNGVVYVSAEGAIYEIDGRTMTARSTITVNGRPGELQFTPDGTLALARNTSQFTGRGAFLIDIAKRTVSDNLATGFGMVDVAIVDNRTAYAVGSNGSVYVLNLGSDGTLSLARANFTGGTPENVREVAVTGELPRARYLVLVTENNLYRVDVAANQLSNDYVALPFRGSITMVTPPVTGGAADILTYNRTQATPLGTTSLPLVVRAYDPSGYPVSGVPVTFTTTVGGVTINSPSVSTGLEGYASTTVTVPATYGGGPIVVNALVGGGPRAAQFTVNIGDPGTTPGGTPGGGTAPPQTGLQLFEGHGQVVSEYFSTSFQQPLSVRLLDSAGNPVRNATIDWSLAQGSGNVNPRTSVTNENGVAVANFTASGVSPLPYLTNTVRASASSVNQEVTFFVTSVPRLRDSPGSASVLWVAPADRIIRAKAGQVIPGAIQVRVASTGTSTPLPYVGLRIIGTNMDPAYTPTAECRGGWALSDKTGLVSCDLAVGAKTGTISINVKVAETVSYNVQLEVTAGDPAAILILNGNNQSANPGDRLVPFLVQVSDVGGNPLPSVPVDWDIPGNASVIDIQRLTDINGRATATIAIGAAQSPGAFTVRARSGSAVAVFNLSVNAVASQMTVVSGDAQTAITGQQFAQPLVVRVVDAQNRPLQGATVSFVASGPASVASSTVTTNSAGIASTIVTAASSAGAVSVRASSGATAATFNLTVRLAGPVFTASDIVDAAGYQPGVSPGSVAYIRATGIATGIRGSVVANRGGALPTQLADVEVLFNNISAPIFAVSNIDGEESVVVQVPFELAPGPASVTIRTAGGGVTTLNNVQILPLKPGVYTFRDANGDNYVVALRPDGSQVTSSNPARRGEQIKFFATGLGQVTPATGTNRVGQSGQVVNAPVIAGVNNAGIRVVSAELAPGEIGRYVITVEIPEDTIPGPNRPFGFAVIGSDGQAVFANGTGIPML